MMDMDNVLGWDITNGKLYRKFTFNDFSEAFGFMTRVAFLAEMCDHHPSWHNQYNVVEIWLTTYDAGNTITEKDKKLALSINAILK